MGLEINSKHSFSIANKKEKNTNTRAEPDPLLMTNNYTGLNFQEKIIESKKQQQINSNGIGPISSFLVIVPLSQ